MELLIDNEMSFQLSFSAFRKPQAIHDENTDTTKHHYDWHAGSWQDHSLRDPRSKYRTEALVHQRRCQAARLSRWLRRGVQKLDGGRGQGQRTPSLGELC